MKVSFDFDGTLQEEEVQEYAKELIDKGVEVWIVTTRYDDNQKHLYIDEGKGVHDDLWEVVDRLGIPRYRVRFTCMEWKWTYLKNTRFLWHLDNNWEEQRHSTKNKIKVPVILNTGDWKLKCEELLR